MMKATIIYTEKDGKKTGTQATGWITENKMESISEKLNLGLLIDYVHGYSGDVVSHPIHKKLNKSNTNFA